MISIKELDFSIIPNVSKIMVIGPTGCGKTTLIKWLLYSKKDSIGAGLIFDEYSPNEYMNFSPMSCICDKYTDKEVVKFVRNQRMFREYKPVVLDNIKTEVFDSEKVIELIKFGRNLNIMYIQSIEYPINLKPVIMANMCGFFLFKTSRYEERQMMWKNYGSVIPNFDIFCGLMDKLGFYEVLYISNDMVSNNWEDSVFYCKAGVVPPGWKMG